MKPDYHEQKELICCGTCVHFDVDRDDARCLCDEGFEDIEPYGMCSGYENNFLKMV
jgi:hypothetical protein